jgi:zinc protease
MEHTQRSRGSAGPSSLVCKAVGATTTPCGAGRLPRIAPLRTAVAVSVLAMLPRAVAGQQEVLAEALKRTELANGLHVVVVENHTVPLASVLVAVRSGAFTQRPGEAGLAHLQEHVLFRAYGPEPGSFQQDVATLNGAYNGVTTAEVVTYFLTLPSDKTEQAIRILAKLVADSHADDDAMDGALPVVLDELAREASDPEAAFARQVAQELWGAGWHRRDVGGDSTSLRMLTKQRLNETYARYYVPNNAALIVTGDVDTTAVFRWAEEHFGSWQRGVDRVAGSDLPPPPALTGNRGVAASKPMYDVSVRIQYRGPGSRADPAAAAGAQIVVQMLNDQSSAFQQRLVEHGPYHWLRVDYEPLQDAGSITFWGKTSQADARVAVTSLLAELERLDELRGVTDEDLAIAKKRRIVDAALLLEQTATLAPVIASWWARSDAMLPLRHQEWDDAEIRRAAADFIRRYLVDTPKVIGVAGPPAVMRRVAAWLRTLQAPS